MRICFIVSEVFAWGSFGGYGTITRSLAEALASAGHDVSALVPKRTNEAKLHQSDVEVLGNLTVFAVPHSYLRRLLRPRIYRLPQADVFIAVDPRFDAFMASVVNPNARHVIWFIDPMTFNDYWHRHAEHADSPRALSRGKEAAIFYVLRFFGWLAVRRADVLMAQREDIAPIRAFPGVRKRSIVDAPNTIEIPSDPIVKSDRPTILFLGRFDRQKQPEQFFRIAQELPEYRFVAAGAASSAERDRELRDTYGNVENLELVGLVAGEQKERLLRESWVLCNTSLREGLPRSFHEALSYGCAIASRVDPDGLVSRYGRVVDDSFKNAIDDLIKSDEWRKLGEQGRRHVKDRHGVDVALRRHLELLAELYEDRPVSAP
jgi:glycosyltransferase involved in cell wall biosynthesis